jgi:hypothetical protein
MPRNFTGNDGYYEIYNQTSIIHQKINDHKTAYKYKIYNCVKNVPNPQDRWRIEQIMVGNGIEGDLNQIKKTIS